MTAQYTRRELEGGRVQFVVTPPDTGRSAARESPNSIAVYGLGAVAVLALFGALSDIGALVWAILFGGGAYGVRLKNINRIAQAEANSGKWQMVIEASPAGVRLPSGSRHVAREDMKSLLWRDWSSGDDGPPGHALYLDTAHGDSFILANGMDRETVTRLADDLSRAVGGVPVEGGAPEPAEGVAAPTSEREAAQARIRELREKHGKDIVTTDTQPMRPGDLVLQETEPGVYWIQRVTESGRERVMPVPKSDDLGATFRFAESNAGGSNLWLEGIGRGPAALMKKATGS